MTTSQKALALYGPLAAATLICAALAGLGCFRAFPVLSGPVKKVCQVLLASGMVIQGAALFPRTWPSRVIIKPHVLAAGSLMLFAGAALLVVLLATGCSSAAATPQADRTMNLPMVKRQWLGACSAHDAPGRIAARSLSAKRTDKTRPLAHGCDPWALRFCVAVRVRSKPRQLCAGRN